MHAFAGQNLSTLPFSLSLSQKHGVTHSIHVHFAWFMHAPHPIHCEKKTGEFSSQPFSMLRGGRWLAWPVIDQSVVRLGLSACLFYSPSCPITTDCWRLTWPYIRTSFLSLPIWHERHNKNILMSLLWRGSGVLENFSRILPQSIDYI